MKAAIILQLLALPAILAKLTVQVVSKPMYMDVTVEGKRETDGQEITMDPSMFGEAGKVAQCLDENSAWTTSCDGQPSYLKVAEFNFDKETTDPRHFTVHTPSWMNSCDITVTGKEGDFVWVVEGGWLDMPDGVLPEGVSIDC